MPNLSYYLNKHMFLLTTERSHYSRRPSRIWPKTNPDKRMVEAIVLSLRRRNKSTNTMLKLARLGKYDYKILVTIIDQCRIQYGMEPDVLRQYFRRRRIVTLLSSLYAETESRPFYDSICRVPFLTKRDQRRIKVARSLYMYRKVKWYQNWPLFLGKRI